MYIFRLKILLHLNRIECCVLAVLWVKFREGKEKFAATTTLQIAKFTHLYNRHTAVILAIMLKSKNILIIICLSNCNFRSITYDGHTSN